MPAGLSAFHFIERRMAPLSVTLAGVVLPHEHYGTHLDSSGKTVDEEKELRNFQKAGEVLCDLWNNLTIDKYDVKCTYRDPTTPTEAETTLDPEWIENHCLISKYCLQIAKCDRINCCKPPRSNLKFLINGKFLPGPLLIKRSPVVGTWSRTLQFR